MYSSESHIQYNHTICGSEWYECMTACSLDWHHIAYNYYTIKSVDTEKSAIAELPLWNALGSFRDAALNKCSHKYKLNHRYFVGSSVQSSSERRRKARQFWLFPRQRHTALSWTITTWTRSLFFFCFFSFLFPFLLLFSQDLKEKFDYRHTLWHV